MVRFAVILCIQFINPFNCSIVAYFPIAKPRFGFNMHIDKRQSKLMSNQKMIWIFRNHNNTILKITYMLACVLHALYTNMPYCWSSMQRAMKTTPMCDECHCISYSIFFFINQSIFFIFHIHYEWHAVNCVILQGSRYSILIIHGEKSDIQTAPLRKYNAVNYEPNLSAVQCGSELS